MNYARFKKAIVSLSLMCVLAISTIVASAVPANAQGYYYYGYPYQVSQPYYGGYWQYGRAYSYGYQNPYVYSYPYGSYRQVYNPYGYGYYPYGYYPYRQYRHYGRFGRIHWWY